MRIDFRTVPVTVPSASGRRTIQGVATFNSQVLRAGVAINGFNLQYSDGDHNVLAVEADTDLVSISGNAVIFNIQCQLRDNSGNDDYSGYVTALVTAEVQ